MYIILSTLHTRKPSHFINFDLTHTPLHPHIFTISHTSHTLHQLTCTLHIHTPSHLHSHTPPPTHYINTLHIHTPHTHTLHQHVPSTSTHLHTCITHTSHTRITPTCTLHIHTPPHLHHTHLTPTQHTTFTHLHTNTFYTSTSLTEGSTSSHGSTTGRPEVSNIEDSPRSEVEKVHTYSVTWSKYINGGNLH